MATMFEIDKAAEDYSWAHAELARRVETLEMEVARIRREHIKAIREAVDDAAAKKAALRQLIDESREQFNKPRTRILHGVKLGLQKGKGKLDWDDDAKVVARIRSVYTKSIAETLIKTVETPIAKALNELDAKDLRALGIRVEETGDQIVVKPTDSEIDKLVDALLEDEPEEAA